MGEIRNYTPLTRGLYSANLSLRSELKPKQGKDLKVASVELAYKT